jgi:PIN domain nuclease of toxin-antitoxin system
VFLWAAQDTKRLSQKVKKILENASSTSYLSSISAYETIYKHGIGKLAEYDYLVSDLAAVADKLSLIELPVRIEHAIMAARLAVVECSAFEPAVCKG